MAQQLKGPSKNSIMDQGMEGVEIYHEVEGGDKKCDLNCST